MSSKSAMEARFRDREGFRLIPVPKHMQPTAESSEAMGERICPQIKKNDVMRNRSVYNASQRTVG